MKPTPGSAAVPRPKPRLALVLSKAPPPAAAGRRWEELKSTLEEHARQNRWSLYADTRLAMAEHLHARGEQALALRYFLEVAYLDLNGPQNQRFFLGRRFDPLAGMLSPAFVQQVTGEADQLLGSREGLEALFLEVAQKARERLRTPLTPAHAWALLRDELPPLEAAPRYLGIRPIK